MNSNQSSLGASANASNPAMRFSLGLIIFSFFNLGHIEGTLLAQNVFILCGVFGYVFSCRGSLFGSLIPYLLLKYLVIRWLFVSWMLFSLVWSINLESAVTRVISTLIIYSVCLVIFDSVRVHGQTRFIIKTIFFVASVCAFVSIISIFNIPVMDRPKSIFGNPNIIALISLMGLVIYFFHRHNFKGTALSALWHMVGISFLVAIFLSSSRKGLLGIVFLFGASFLRRSSRKRLGIMAMAAVPVAIIFFGSSLLTQRGQLTMGHFEVLGKLGDVSTLADESFVERATYIDIGIEKISESPFIGYGLESFRLFNNMEAYSHNNYIEICVSLGLIGLGLFYFSYLHLLFACLNRFSFSSENGVFVVFLVMVMILDVGFVSYLFKPWILMFILIAAQLSRGRDDGLES